MDALDGFTVEEQLGVYRPAGCVSIEEAVALVRAAITAARRQRVRKLLVDTTALTGFSPPETFTRFFAVVQWAEEAGGALSVAVVARPEMIDWEKFGVSVAKNRCLESNVFVTEAEARAWLEVESADG